MVRSLNRAVGTDAEGNRAEATDETAEDTPSTPVEWRDIAETPLVSDTGASSEAAPTAGDEPPIADRIRSRSGPSLRSTHRSLWARRC